MSSAHRIDLIKDLTLVSRVVNGVTQGFIENHPDIYDANGNKLNDVQLTQGGIAYSKTVALLPKFNDYIFTALCGGCAVNVTLEFSPDGVNWCNCVLSDGQPCSVACDPVGNTIDCQVKVVDVPLLQYVRVKIDSSASTNLSCDIFLTHTMNY